MMIINVKWGKPTHDVNMPMLSIAEKQTFRAHNGILLHCQPHKQYTLVKGRMTAQSCIAL